MRGVSELSYPDFYTLNSGQLHLMHVTPKFSWATFRTIIELNQPWGAVPWRVFNVVEIFLNPK